MEQVRTERGLIAVDETIRVHNAEEARLAGFAYAWHSDMLHSDLYTRCLDEEGHKRIFIRVVDLKKEIRLCLLDAISGAHS